MAVTHLTNQSQFVQSNAAFNGTNITGTIASNGISLSVAAPGAGGGAAISGGTNSQNTGTVNFSNSNGVTFGLNTNGVMTATVATNYQSVGAYLTTAALSDHSHGNPTLALTNISGTTASNSAGLTLSLSANPAGGADGVNILAAGTQTANTTGSVLFNNGNGVTFGMSNNSVITASHNGLTTAMASNRGSDFVNVAGAVTGTNITGTLFSNGLSLSVAAPGAGGGIGIAAGTRTATTANTLLFDNANGITFGLNAVAGSIMTASHNAITTARASNDAIGLNTALTANGVAWTVNSSGLSLNVPAFLTTAALSNHSHNFATTTTNGALIVVGTTNSVGATIGVPAFLTTAQAPGAYLTTARASNDAIGLNTALTAGPLAWTVNSSGLSLNAVSVAGTTSGFGGNLISGSMTHNTAGLNLSLNHPAWLTTAMQTGSQSQLWVMGNSSATIGGTNISGTMYSNGMSLSAAAPGGGADVVASASNGSFSFTTLGFSNANNVTFGTSAGGIITASVAAPGAAAENNWVNLLGANTAGNTTASGSTIGYSGINLTLSGTNGSIVNISAPAVSSLVGASGISISTNGSTITVGKVLQSTYVPYMAYSTNSQTIAALGATSGSARFFPIMLSDNIIFNELRVMHNLSYATSSVSGQQTISYQYGLFSNNAGTLSSISSGSFSFAVTNSSISNTVSYPVSTGTDGYTYTTLGASSSATIQSYFGTAAGGRIIGLQFGNTMSLSSGQYWLGVNLRHSSSSANIGISIAIGGNANALHNSIGYLGQITGNFTTGTAQRVPYMGLGAYTVSQSSLPNGVPLTQIAHTQTVHPLITFIST